MNLMKKINKVYFNSLLILFLVATSFFSIPSVNVFAGTGATPTITIKSPAANALLHQMTVEISGNYSDINDNVKLNSDLTFRAKDNVDGNDLGEISNSDTNASEWNISDPDSSGDGTWTFTKSFSDEGTHAVTIIIEEKNTDPLISNQTNITFTLDTNRPYMSGEGIVYKDKNQYIVLQGDTLESIAQDQLKDPSLWTDIAQLNNISSPTKVTQLPEGTKIDLPTKRTGEDLTSIPENAVIKIQLTDDKPMTKLVSKINNDAYNPINLKLNNTTIDGTASILENTVKENGNYVYDICFTPNVALTLEKVYLVYLDPNDPKLVDDSNGSVYAKFFKFTTKSNAVWDEMDDQNHDSYNPHGHYQLNTNMCAACHSTHVDSPYQKGITAQLKTDREGGSYLIDFNQKLNAKASENYCTACHDGTLNNAPIVDGIEDTYHHDNPADFDQANGTNNLKDATSCTSCHNPHLEWSESNPNLLKDHYVYTHNEDIKYQNGEDYKDQNGDPTRVVDSLDTKCETCHQDNLIHNGNGSVTSIYDNQSSNYQVLSYKKSLTADGAITDYSLCLRCHKADKSGTDIETFYLNSNSGHKFTLPSDDGGSKLNGQMPCSECHETHGANNIKMLRDKYGNDPETMDTFSKTTTDWTPADERTFCLKCHNNKTEIYGKVGTFDDTITGHQVGYKEGDTEEGCSHCHGGTSKTFIEAAHAPQNP